MNATNIIIYSIKKFPKVLFFPKNRVLHWMHGRDVGPVWPAGPNGFGNFGKDLNWFYLF
jgi:hypothetical protein